MDEILHDVMDIVKRSSVTESLIDILLCAVPIWVAVMIGLVIGWSWRPRWTGLVFLGLRSKFLFIWTAPPGLGARRLWLAVTGLSAFSVWSSFRDKGKVRGSAGDENVGGDDAASDGQDVTPSPSTNTVVREHDIVTENDLEHLLYLLEGKTAEMEWQCVMDRSIPNMSYQAWRNEPETGPTIFRSKTVFEDATPELVRDFFWDDEFRPKWDPMLAYVKIMDECPHTGTMIVHWIKKFPFFCSDREYIIGRRIWEAGRTYYCLTKAVPYPALQKHDKPRRVELYFSSWIIRPVESRKGDGQLSACEVTLVHYEDMGIPKDVAKLGVRHGMWGAVKKLHSGLRAYQNARKLDASLSRCALMAKITKNISFHGCHSSEPGASEEENARIINSDRQRGHGIDWKWVAIGTMALACGLQMGVFGKVFLLGAGRRLVQR